MISNHIKGAKKRRVYCYDLSNMKFIRSFDGQRIMVRELKLSSTVLIKRKLDREKVFRAKYKGEVINWYIKSRPINDQYG